MPVPTYDAFFPLVLEGLLPGEVVDSPTIRDFAAQRMRLTDADRQEMLPSGAQSVFINRVSWAVVYLKKAGLVVSAGRGKYQITASGKAAYQQTGGQVDLAYLRGIQSFAEFKGEEQAEASTVAPALSPLKATTPMDDLDAAYRTMNASLAEELLTEIMVKSPAFFERLVVNLLLKIGYGGTVENPGTVLGRTGDEGIDGVIREDKLGFSHIYIQAKRWDASITVGRPEIQKFMGALAGQGGGKGLYISTARFSREAIDYAARQHIVLVDGRKLTELMIAHNLGVSTRMTYEIKRVDGDFFVEEE